MFGSPDMTLCIKLQAPLSLSFEASWLEINKGFLDVLEEWMDHILLSYTDTYFVTELQVDEL